MNFRQKNTILVVTVSLLVGVGIFIWLGKVIGWDKIGGAFKVFEGWQGIVMICFSILILLIGGWRWYEILKDEKAPTSFWRLWQSYLGGYALMYLFPIIFLSGEIFRVVDVHKEGKIPLSKATASVIIERILEWTVNIIFIFFALFFFAFKLEFLPLQVLYIFGLALVLFVGMVAFFYFKAFRQRGIVRGIVRKFTSKELSEGNTAIAIENEILKFFQGKKHFNKGLAISVLRAGVIVVRTWLLIIFLTGINIGLPAALSIVGLTFFSALIPIPTSLGSHEVIQAASFDALGLEASAATAFTMIIRACETIISLVGLAFI
jgi:uncharacterized protein (TIRG00374 family)